MDYFHYFFESLLIFSSNLFHLCLPFLDTKMQIFHLFALHVHKSHFFVCQSSTEQTGREIIDKLTMKQM